MARVQQREEPGSTTTALARWESEGGKPLPSSGELPGSDGNYGRGLPSLPAGFTSQVAWGFRDASEGHAYDFYRVYGPSRLLHGLGPICALDEDLSYWLTIFWSSDQTAQQHPACRWMSYAQARKLVGRSLSYSRFSSPRAMQEEVPRLLQAAGIPADPRPTETFRFLRRLTARGQEG